MSDISKTPTRFAILGISMLVLAACSDTLAPGANEGGTVAIDPPSEVVVPVELELKILETLFSDASPKEDLVGSVRFDGSVTSSNPGEFARISDNSGEKYEFLSIKVADLQPGRYRWQSQMRFPANQTVDDQDIQSLLRIDPVDTDSMRSSLFISPNGEPGRMNGLFTAAVSNSTLDGFTEMNVFIEVTPETSGRYKLMVYPAAGAGNAYTSTATGAIEIGNIRLDKVEPDR
ncbi:hypothetical protein [Robiginitomaculum antarcticum]|uniref:hypothetical protein n=1 Tax=Robiginitomaculum antarcticum TaxID=437507 RepID=UPI0003AA835A|nr:hypothetical protein [Robiginitomaculum antarcticum]